MNTIDLGAEQQMFGLPTEDRLKFAQDFFNKTKQFMTQIQIYRCDFHFTPISPNYRLDITYTKLLGQNPNDDPLDSVTVTTEFNYCLKQMRLSPINDNAIAFSLNLEPGQSPDVVELFTIKEETMLQEFLKQYFHPDLDTCYNNSMFDDVFNSLKD